jgi:acetylglutamate kinase
VKEVIDKAAVLIEALPYIQQFRGSTIVIKLGGSAMEDRAHVESVLTDVAFMRCVGMRPVIVHGGGKAISRGMQREGIESRFLHGLRVTCERTIRVVENVLGGEVNPGIVAGLVARGAPARGVSGEGVFHARRKAGTDPATGEELDWGFVGEPANVDTGQVEALLESGTIPVVTPLGRGEDGRVHNMNADTAAGAAARALLARKLVYLSDVPGLLRDASDPESLIATLRVGEVEYLVEQGVISGGMLPKVASGVEALRAGVNKVHMIDGRLQHSLLLELFTEKGVGTEIVKD